MAAGSPPTDNLTVAICTWNRAPLLAMTLERLGEPGVLTGSAEVLVVDNGSTDDTPGVVARCQDRLPAAAHADAVGIPQGKAFLA